MPVHGCGTVEVGGGENQRGTGGVQAFAPLLVAIAGGGGQLVGVKVQDFVQPFETRNETAGRRLIHGPVGCGVKKGGQGGVQFVLSVVLAIRCIEKIDVVCQALIAAGDGVGLRSATGLAMRLGLPSRGCVLVVAGTAGS